MRVPFLDLKACHGPLRPHLDAAIAEVIEQSAFAGGPFVERFEKDFARYCGTSHAIGVGNGTDALWFALLAAGIGPGDEVITVSNTFAATVEAIVFCGARPIFVDVQPGSLLLDPQALAAALSPRTKALIPVHLFGRLCDMEAINAFAAAHGLSVIEDACQAHGALFQGRRAGSLSLAGCFSFYPGKNLGALGEAGAVVTNDDALAARIRCLRDHGQSVKYHHRLVGWNGRMDGIQAAALSVKLPHLDRWNEARRSVAERYQGLLGDLSDTIVLPETGPREGHVYHLFPLRTPARDRLLSALHEDGISCGIHYPVPLHLQEAFAHLGLGPGSLPVTEEAAPRLLSLPLYPELGDDAVTQVCTRLRIRLKELLA